MRPTSVARWDFQYIAAGGRRRCAENTVAVKKCERKKRAKQFLDTARRHEVITRRSLVQVLPLHSKKESVANEHFKVIVCIC